MTNLQFKHNRVLPSFTMSSKTKMQQFSKSKLVHLLLVIPVIAAQAAILEHYLVTLNKFENSILYLLFVAGDVFVIATFIAMHVLGEKAKKKSPPDDSADGPVRHLGILPYAWVSWTAYAIVLAAKIICMFKTYGPKLTDSEEDEVKINNLQFTIGASALVFILLLGGAESKATHAQEHYLRWMEHYVTLELIDGVESLTFLFVNAELGPEKPWPSMPLRDAVLGLACVNLLLPGLALYWLNKPGNPHGETRNRFFLTQTLMSTALGNLPSLGIRLYFWQFHSYLTGIFAMKNAIGIFQDAREVYEGLQERYGKKPADSQKQLAEEAGALRAHAEDLTI